MSGPTQAMKEAWREIIDDGKGIRMQAEPEPCGKYLGCNHVIRNGKLDKNGQVTIEGKKVSNFIPADAPVDDPNEVKLVKWSRRDQV